MSYFASGTWNVICDVCGQKYKATEVRKRWDGLLVCSEDFETDHPQKFIRVEADGQSVPDPRPRPIDEFLPVCDFWSTTCRAGFGTAGCATVGQEASTDFLFSLFPGRQSSLAGVALAGYALAGVP
jgi:hypothetical protein